MATAPKGLQLNGCKKNPKQNNHLNLKAKAKTKTCQIRPKPNLFKYCVQFLLHFLTPSSQNSLCHLEFSVDSMVMSAVFGGGCWGFVCLFFNHTNYCSIALQCVFCHSFPQYLTECCLVGICRKGCVNIIKKRVRLHSFSMLFFKSHWECLHNCSKEAFSMYLFILFTFEILEAISPWRALTQHLQALDCWGEKPC